MTRRGVKSKRANNGYQHKLLHRFRWCPRPLFAGQGIRIQAFVQIIEMPWTKQHWGGMEIGCNMSNEEPLMQYSSWYSTLLCSAAEEAFFWIRSLRRTLVYFPTSEPIHFWSAARIPELAWGFTSDCSKGKWLSGSAAENCIEFTQGIRSEHISSCSV